MTTRRVGRPALSRRRARAARAKNLAPLPPSVGRFARPPLTRALFSAPRGRAFRPLRVENARQHHLHGAYGDNAAMRSMLEHVGDDIHRAQTHAEEDGAPATASPYEVDDAVVDGIRDALDDDDGGGAPRRAGGLCGLAGAHPDWYNDPGQHTGLAAWYLRRARWFHELVTDGDDPPLVTFNNFIMLNIIIAGVLVGLMTCAPRRARRAARARSASGTRRGMMCVLSPPRSPLPPCSFPFARPVRALPRRALQLRAREV